MFNKRQEEPKWTTTKPTKPGWYRCSTVTEESHLELSSVVRKSGDPYFEVARFWVTVPEPEPEV